MGFLEEFFADRNGRSQSRRKKTRTTVKHGKYDKRVFDQTLQSVREFELDRRRLCDHVPTSGQSLSIDQFMLWYKAKVEPEDRDAIDEEFWLNALVRDKMIGLREFPELREHTATDPISAAIAFCTTREKVERFFDETKAEQEKVEELRQRMQQLREVAEQIDDLDDKIEQLEQEEQQQEEEHESDDDDQGDSGEDGDSAESSGDGGEATDGPGEGCGAGAGSSGPGSQELADAVTERAALADQASSLADAVDEARAAADKALAEKEGELERHLRQGVNEAIEDAETVQAGMSILSHGSGAGNLQRLPVEERLQLIRRLQGNRELLDLAKMIGRNIRELRAEQRQDTKYGYEHVQDIAPGDDLQKLLPIELAALRHPVLKKDALCRLDERALLQLEYSGEERVGLGSIIAAVDGSYSMNGLPHRWAVGLAGGVAMHAFDTDRSFLGIHFGSASELAEFHFEPDDCPPDRMLDFLTHFFGGGTDFQAPLSLALDHLRAEHEETGKVKGDILFITDGVARVRDDWLEEFKAERERLGFHVFGICIGDAIGGTGYGSQLAEICDDRLVAVTDLSSPNDVRQVFRELHRD